MTTEESFLDRMKQRQKERERKRNEIRKFHQVHQGSVFSGSLAPKAFALAMSKQMPVVTKGEKFDTDI